MQDAIGQAITNVRELCLPTYTEERMTHEKILREGAHVYMERAENGFQYVYRGDVIIAVHGTFCTGCDATRGRCGDLTRMYTEARA